jgi:hypothetical protein
VRDGVTVRVSGQQGVSPRQVQVGHGASVTFGRCWCDGCDLDLTLDNEGPWFVGLIAAATGYWMVTNLTPGQALLVTNAENPHEYFTVESGRQFVPMPFEMARVATSVDPACHVTVVGTQLGSRPRLGRTCPAAPKKRSVLDRHATYYAVLRTLCEPRLRGSTTNPLPTSDVIATALGLTARSVDAHVEYLVDKLGLDRRSGREVLVATAIRRRLVPITNGERRTPENGGRRGLGPD